MPTIAQIRDLAHKHSLRLEYVIDSIDSEHIELSYRDDDYNYHSAKITMDNYGVFYSLIINTSNVDAMMRFIAFWNDFKTFESS